MATQVAPDTLPEARGAQPRTIPRLWQDAVAAKRTSPAYLVERNGGWEPVPWPEAATAVEELANGLLALGIRKGDAFGILGQTSLEWALFDFALAHVGAIGAAIYANSAAKDCEYILDHSESVGVLVEDAEQLAKLANYRSRNPRLAHVLTYADLDELRARGRDYAAAHPGELADITASVSPDDVFTYIYTSGTTGPPKACMIRHRNYYAMACVVDEIDDFTMADDTMLLYLPLAHNFGRLMHLQGPYVGFTLAFLPDPLRAAEALKAVKPTLFPSVPRVFEKVHTAVLAKFDDETGAKRKIVDWALGVGRKASKCRAAGKPLGPVLGAQHRVADRLVYSKVKANLGGNFRIGISGGAPLSKEIAEFFHALDVLILEGYGLTECTTAATVNRPSRFRFGTVGPALPGTELRIADDGEVLIKSPTVFAGYYKDEEATREILDEDGWLRSGDIGELDADGFLSITDRKKDIIVTAGGKNVAPQNLENELKASKFVSQALVIGDQRPYCVALITLDEPELVKWAHAHGLKGELSLAELSQRDEVRELVEPIVERVNAEHSRYEQIKKFTILKRDFTMGDDELTPTLKLKRRACQEHFASEIDALYTD
ncbi:MAG TPA: long-chain fatty acid--CoA ligase [Gaiellaceae bacterium]|nr:long-chain fatty acid--CoA ligase [Gaiellaceae bacterium]